MMVPSRLLKLSMWLVAFVAMLLSWPLYWIEAQCTSFAGWVACFSISRAAIAGLLAFFGAGALLYAAKWLAQRNYLSRVFSRGGTYLYVTTAWVWNERTQIEQLHAVGVFTLEDEITALTIHSCTIWYRDRIGPDGSRLRRGTWRSEILEKRDDRLIMAYRTSIENRLPSEARDEYTAIHNLPKQSPLYNGNELWAGDVEGKGIKGKMACTRVDRGKLEHHDALTIHEHKIASLLAYAPLVEQPFR
jgi:hypothetical protein